MRIPRLFSRPPSDDEPAASDHPGCRSGHSLTGVVDGQLLYGGLQQDPDGSPREVCSADLFLLDTQTLAWRRVACEGNPAPVFAHCAAVVGRGEPCLAVFGGMLDGGATTSQLSLLSGVDQLNTRAGKPPPRWRCKRGATRGEVWPEPRWGHSGVRTPAGELLVFGGMTASECVDDLWLFDPDTRAWRQQAGGAGPAPAPRRRHTATVDPKSDVMFVFGGRSRAGEHYNDLWTLSLSAFTWRAVEMLPGAPKPRPRVGHVASICGGTLAIYGGSTLQPSCEAGFDVSNDAWTISTSACSARREAGGGGAAWVSCTKDAVQRQARTMAASFVSHSGGGDKKMCLFVYGGRGADASFDTLFDIELPRSASPARRQRTLRNRTPHANASALCALGALGKPASDRAGGVAAKRSDHHPPLSRKPPSSCFAPVARDESPCRRAVPDAPNDSPFSSFAKSRMKSLSSKTASYEPGHPDAAADVILPPRSPVLKFATSPNQAQARSLGPFPRGGFSCAQPRL